jgi:hypothetical protein
MAAGTQNRQVQKPDGSTLAFVHRDPAMHWRKQAESLAPVR